MLDVTYAIGVVPSVVVTSPPLACKTPHTYGRGRLCLYRPSDWRWHSGRLLADTLFPWSALWLYYYELWLDTNEWLAPEAPHGDELKELDAA